MSLYESLPLYADGSWFRLLEFEFDLTGAYANEITIHATMDIYNIGNAP